MDSFEDFCQKCSNDLVDLDILLWQGQICFPSFHMDWLVGCFGLNGPLRQYFSLYRAISQRGRKKKENDR